MFRHFSSGGRATVIPEIAIIVNDQPTFVSVGTTLPAINGKVHQ